MGEMPTFTSTDVDLIMTLSITGTITPEEVKQVTALRDKLNALIDYYGADYVDDDWEDDYEDD